MLKTAPLLLTILYEKSNCHCCVVNDGHTSTWEILIILTLPDRITGSHTEVLKTWEIKRNLGSSFFDWCITNYPVLLSSKVQIIWSRTELLWTHRYFQVNVAHRLLFWVIILVFKGFHSFPVPLSAPSPRVYSSSPQLRIYLTKPSFAFNIRLETGA